uniref:Bromo domain-containing protein n=1 Tax=Panagrolaimus superbus TaxID=310955 RepID=A0A914YCR9_9BILA
MGGVTMNARNDGRQISADFIQLPSKRELPAYYKQVLQPMDFTRLRKNLKHGHYDTIDAFGNDIKLLVSNCQSFNREDSEIYHDSETILAIWERLKASATALL